MELVLKKHHLKHLPELKVSDNIFSLRFSPGCSMSNCDGTCCELGVFADINEQQNILAHAELILKHMEPHQEHNPCEWFDHNDFKDKDFPSGRAVGTQARDYGCIFLDSSGRCTLQKAAINEGMHPFALKPFYCIAFPITVDGGILMIDDVHMEDRPTCCKLDLNGGLTVFDVCPIELEYVLGREGLAELKNIAVSKL